MSAQIKKQNKQNEQDVTDQLKSLEIYSYYQPALWWHNPVTIGLSVTGCVLLGGALLYWLLRGKREQTDYQWGVLQYTSCGVLLESGDYQQFYFTLTDSIKQALERITGAPVRGMTATELRGYLAQKGDDCIGLELKKQIRELVQYSVEVKFAHKRPTPKKAESGREVLRALICLLSGAPEKKAEKK